jgi:hypothetical protein
VSLSLCLIIHSAAASSNLQFLASWVVAYYKKVPAQSTINSSLKLLEVWRIYIPQSMLFHPPPHPPLNYDFVSISLSLRASLTTGGPEIAFCLY